MSATGYIKRTFFSALIPVLSMIPGFSQRIARFDVELPAATGGLVVPVSVNLDEVTFLADSVLTLVEMQGNKKIPVTFQVEQGTHRHLHWLVNNNGPGKYSYLLIKGTPGISDPVMTTPEKGALIIHDGNRELVSYHYETVYPPAGVDTFFKRSAFIHPLWTPHGQVLTRIQPPDHYHHYGLWNPWTHVLYDKDTIDFWNLGSHQGTVRFGGFADVVNGPVYAEYSALHEHVVLKGPAKGKVAITELQTVRVYHPGKDYYIMDITSQLNCADTIPVKLLEYRYGGLGWRTTAYWNKDNSEVLTSEGKTRKDADGTHARWCIVQGALNNDYGGAVMMSYPTNYNYPEPLRIWPLNQNGRGDMYANFSPTKDKDWLLVPGHKYVLKYRWVVFNGHFSKEKAESAWQYFAEPPNVIIKK